MDLLDKVKLEYEEIRIEYLQYEREKQETLHKYDPPGLVLLDDDVTRAGQKGGHVKSKLRMRWTRWG